MWRQRQLCATKKQIFLQIPWCGFSQYLLLTREVRGRTDRVMASAGSHRLSVKQAAVWSDVTSPPSIIAGSVGGTGRRSRERQRLIEWVTQREGKKTHTHTHAQYTALSAPHTHTNTHIYTLAVGLKWQQSSVLRQSGEEPVQVFITQVCVCVRLTQYFSLWCVPPSLSYCSSAAINLSTQLQPYLISAAFVWIIWQQFHKRAVIFLCSQDGISLPFRRLVI